MNNENKSIVLIVDDNSANLSILFNYLQEANFKVLIAEKGLSALKRVEHTKPDIILLDIVMPGIDGFETCRRLKNNPQTQDIPVIFMTALSDTLDKLKGFDMGAVDYITKPFQQEEVLARINIHLTIRQLQKELQTKNEQLHRQNELLTQLNQERNELLGIAVHNLKNPLAAIQTTAELITSDFNTIPSENLLEMMGMVSYASRHMFDLIQNLLDANAIESGNRHITLEVFDVLPMLQSLVKNFHNQAKVKNITLQFQYQKQQYPILVDYNAIYQVIDNLISNAIKYSPHNKPIHIRLIQKENKVRCEVQDEGVGLNQSDQQKLFGKFTRLTAKPTGQELSTGLGLFIVKKLVEAMNGEVWCESELGQGSTFIVEFAIADQ